MPHAEPLPPTMSVNVIPPETAVGVVFATRVPSPSSPRALLPQQYALPSVVRPQVKSPDLLPPARPPKASFLKRRPPATAAGVTCFFFVPLPNCPYELLPQQYASPTGVSAQTYDD